MKTPIAFAFQEAILNILINNTHETVSIVDLVNALSGDGWYVSVSPTLIQNLQKMYGFRIANVEGTHMVCT